MSSSEALRGLRESVWLDQGKYEQAEGRYQEVLASRHAGITVEGRSVGVAVGKSGLSDSIGATMSIIQQSLTANTQSGRHADLEQRVGALERENRQLKKDLQELVGRVAGLEARLGASTAAPTSSSVATAGGEEDEDFDLFGSDGEEDEVKAEQEKKAQAYQQKAKKPALVAKSTIILEVKPWDTETDMAEMERLVRGIATDGLLWGASKLVPVAYGIMKLQISCVVEDEKVGTDFLEESITAFEDHVQSVDVVAFNKI